MGPRRRNGLPALCDLTTFVIQRRFLRLKDQLAADDNTSSRHGRRARLVFFLGNGVGSRVNGGICRFIDT